MNRRNFLKLLGLTLLNGSVIACGGENGAENGMSNKGRTIVVGAGLAGLAAAKELKRSGQDVLVLEGRDRIGGRIWTSTAWADMPLDLGASWIHGVRGNPLTALADEIQAERLVTSYEKTATYNTSGALLTADEEARLERIGNALRTTLRQAQDQNTDLSIRAAAASLAQQFGNSSESARFLNFLISSEIEHEYSGSAGQISTHWFDSDREFGGDDVLFTNGFQTITHYLAQGLQIELSQPVTEIYWGPSDVRVVTQTAEFTAERVIVTLPLGVLQSNRVLFKPELPGDIRQAISRLGMGVLNKCYLRFQQPFWPADVDWLGYVSARHGEWNEWVSFKRVANMPVLLGFNAADRGREIEAWSDERIVASAMETLNTIFGGEISQPIAHQITRWATDPFSLGSYSYNALGSTPEMRKLLARPVDARLFFAGEAAHEEYFGTAHGAYLSGVSAAKRVLSSA